jgi:hypothetical protein
MKKDERKGENVSVPSYANRPKNKRTFITLSLNLFLTCREEKKYSINTTLYIIQQINVWPYLGWWPMV